MHASPFSLCASPPKITLTAPGAGSPQPWGPASPGLEDSHHHSSASPASPGRLPSCCGLERFKGKAGTCRVGGRGQSYRARQGMVGFAGVLGNFPSARLCPLIFTAGSEWLMGRLVSPVQPPLRSTGDARLPPSPPGVRLLVHRRRWTWSEGLCCEFASFRGGPGPHSITSSPSSIQPQPCSPGRLCRGRAGHPVALAALERGRGGCQRRMEAAGDWDAAAGQVPSSRPRTRCQGAARAGAASGAEVWGRRGSHSLSTPSAPFRRGWALACRDDGADDALGLRRKAEKSCHGDQLCHFKEARRHSHPSLSNEPQQQEVRGARWG